MFLLSVVLSDGDVNAARRWTCLENQLMTITVFMFSSLDPLQESCQPANGRESHSHDCFHSYCSSKYFTSRSWLMCHVSINIQLLSFCSVFAIFPRSSLICLMMLFLIYVCIILISCLLSLSYPQFFYMLYLYSSYVYVKYSKRNELEIQNVCLQVQQIVWRHLHCGAAEGAFKISKQSRADRIITTLKHLRSSVWKHFGFDTGAGKIPTK